MPDQHLCFWYSDWSLPVSGSVKPDNRKKSWPRLVVQASVQAEAPPWCFLLILCERERAGLNVQVWTCRRTQTPPSSVSNLIRPALSVRVTVGADSLFSPGFHVFFFLCSQRTTCLRWRRPWWLSAQRGCSRRPAKTSSRTVPSKIAGFLRISLLFFWIYFPSLIRSAF